MPNGRAIVSWRARSKLLLTVSIAASAALFSLAAPLRAEGDKKTAQQTEKPTSTLDVLPPPSNTPPVFTWQQLQSGVTVCDVRNSSDAKRTISTEVTNLGFDWDSNHAQSTTDLALIPASTDLPAHSLIRLSLTLQNPDADTPKQGLYAVTLVIWDVTDGKDKYKGLEVPLQVKVAGAEPAVDKLTLTAWRWIPASPRWSAKLSVPLKEGDAFPTPCDKQEILGVVRRDVGGWADVRCESARNGAKASKGSNGRSRAEVVIDDLPYAGMYTGNLAFHKGDTQPNSLALTVYAKDIFIWPVLVILLGIGLAFLVKRFLGVLRTTWGMREQEAGLGDLFQESQTKFAEATRGKSYGKYSVAKDVASQRQVIREHLTEIEKSWVTTLDDTNPDFKAAVTGLQAVQAEIAAWGQFGPELQALAEALDSLQRTIDHRGIIPKGPPQFLAPAQKLLKGTGVIDAAKLAAIQKEVADAITLAQSWGEAEERANGATQILTQLQLRTDLSDAEKRAVAQAQNQLAAVWEHLWQVQAVTDLSTIVAAGGNLDSAEVSLAQTLADHGQPFPQTSVKVTDTLMLAASTDAAQAISPQAEIASREARTSRRIEMLSRAVRLGDAGSVALAFVIAVLTGLNMYYLGGNTAFGTAQDYIKLFLWGAGTQAGLNIVTAVFDKLVPVGSIVNPK